MDGALVIMPDLKAEEDFLTTLNKPHSDTKFAMELLVND